MPEIKNSRTESNLRSAVSGEAQAMGLYMLFSERAKEEGFEELAEIFREIANNEKAHAEIYWKLLNSIGTTAENLCASKLIEEHECRVMYPEFASIAREEGLTDVAETLEKVGAIEEKHRELFEKLENKMRTNGIFSGTSNSWICRN